MTSVRELSDSEARRLIADALDETVLVEAAAGTGKTTELVGRIVSILAEGCAEVREIVAVTFTEKAAGELKLRLRERLDAERSRPDQGPSRRAHLDAALKRLEEAHISTIHGFCADLLRERPVEAGVDPLFEVLTEPASAKLFDAAFDRWLQQALEEPPEGLRRALKRTALGGEGGPIDRVRKAAWDLAQWRDFTAAWTRVPFDRVREIEAVIEALHDVAALTGRASSHSDPVFTATEAVRRLSAEISLQRTFEDATPPADYDGWEAALTDLSRERTLAYARQGRGAAYGPGVPRDRVWQAVQDLRARLDGFRMAADADLAALLDRELRGAIDRYEATKAKSGALDFLDLLLRARDLVRDNGEVRRGFQQRFKRIFVDEFQDTDPLQAEILLLLTCNDPEETDWRRARPAPGRLFLVGDPKQSIYRFRRADVAVYREVCAHLVGVGARFVRLTRSFRSVPAVQAAVNAAFARLMTGDATTLQAEYVALEHHRLALPEQPAVVVLPVPAPYARRHITAAAIEQSMPGAVGAFVDWLVNSSRWMVTERTGAAPVPITAKHVCLLFRRFTSYQTDVTRGYVEALESRGIPHVLVGGKAFHEREEVEAIRAALAAIEWPDDELSVFATLRGPFFAIGDEELLEWAWRFGRQQGDVFRRHSFHPFRVPEAFAGDTPADVEHLRPVADALGLLRRLHRRRNHSQVSRTLAELLAATRAHVGLALRTGGEQALANVLHVAELARRYEADGGISFRGFIEELRIAADTAQASEAPILEEDSEGVRMMTVHKAKGLEFPVVILVDPSCKLSRPDAARWIDPSGQLCALKLGGWTPTDLLLNGGLEAERDKAEGQRLAYVAATRARDVLVVPAIGDEPFEGGWLDPLTPAVYPPVTDRRRGGPAPGCPAFLSKDSVMNRPDGDPAQPSTVSPGLFDFNTYSVVWWDPHVLDLAPAGAQGIRREDLIAKDGDPAMVAARRAAYDAWKRDVSITAHRAAAPSVRVRTATAVAEDRAADVHGNQRLTIELVDGTRAAGRPFGPRFGSLVHATLATVSLEATPEHVSTVARAQGRILLAPDEEIEAAAHAVASVLRHPLFDRIRAAARCQRELPVMWVAPDGSLIEGTVDLAFEEPPGLTVVEFKTDRELEMDRPKYERQVALYCRALAALQGVTTRGILLRV